MPIANKMTTLLNKIEINLGTKPMNLPKEIAKPMWADPDQGPIALFTIPTFSRYFPNKITVRLEGAQRLSEGWYLLDEAVGIPEGVTIIGVRDIDWSNYNGSGYSMSLNNGYGIYMPYSGMYHPADIMMNQGMFDLQSAFGNANNIFVEFQEPNKIRLSGVSGINMAALASQYPIDVFINHNLNLSTISPTKMETFEALACADVANFLYKFLRHYENLESVFSNINMGLDEINSVAQTRTDVIAQLENAYVSAANDNQPLMFTI